MLGGYTTVIERYDSTSNCLSWWRLPWQEQLRAELNFIIHPQTTSSLPPHLIAVHRKLRQDTDTALLGVCCIAVLPSTLLHLTVLVSVAAEGKHQPHPSVSVRPSRLHVDDRWMFHQVQMLQDCACSDLINPQESKVVLHRCVAREPPHLPHRPPHDALAAVVDHAHRQKLALGALFVLRPAVHVQHVVERGLAPDVRPPSIRELELPDPEERREIHSNEGVAVGGDGQTGHSLGPFLRRHGRGITIQHAAPVDELNAIPVGSVLLAGDPVLRVQLGHDRCFRARPLGLPTGCKLVVRLLLALDVRHVPVHFDGLPELLLGEEGDLVAPDHEVSAAEVIVLAALV
eukprot:761596-Hanusia_phi.AAC.4